MPRHLPAAACFTVRASLDPLRDQRAASALMPQHPFTFFPEHEHAAATLPDDSACRCGWTKMAQKKAAANSSAAASLLQLSTLPFYFVRPTIKTPAFPQHFDRELFRFM